MKGVVNMGLIEWIALLLPVVLTAIIGLIFNTKLENHKHILQKKVQDFSLYNEKKHICYAELYKLIRLAEGSILGLRGLTTRPSFDDYNKVDVENYLDGFSTPKKVIREVVDLWDINKNRAIEIIREYEKYRDLKKSENAFFEARNYWLINELYFDENINIKINEYFKTLYNLYVNYENPEEVPRKENRELKSKIEVKFNELKDSMKKELSSFTEE